MLFEINKRSLQMQPSWPASHF